MNRGGKDLLLSAKIGATWEKDMQKQDRNHFVDEFGHYSMTKNWLQWVISGAIWNPTTRNLKKMKGLEHLHRGRE